MDIRRELRNLITNTYMPNFDYFKTYTFKTVCYLPGVGEVYCLCNCGFEHELVDYISESGEINETMFLEVVNNIINGKCVHVADVPDTHVRETEIFALHIAAVVGTTEAVNRHLHKFVDKKGKLFGMDANKTAMVKRNNQTVSLFCESAGCKRYSRTGFGTLCKVTCQQDSNKREVRRLSGVEFCVVENDRPMLNSLFKRIIHTPSDIAGALESALKRNSKEIVLDLLNYIRRMGEQNAETVRCCAKVTIVYNFPKLLYCLLQQVLISPLQKVDKQELEYVAYLLQRKTCKVTLSTCKPVLPIPSLEKLSVCDQLNMLLDLFMSHNDALKDDFWPIFEHVLGTQKSEVPEKGNCHENSQDLQKSLLNMYVSKTPFVQNGCNFRYIKRLQDLGADINHMGGQLKRTPLANLLDTRSLSLGYREVLESLIFQNSDIFLNAGIGDSCYHRYKTEVIPSGNYIMDRAGHSIFGHNDPEDYALNFEKPLLIECGYHLSELCIEKGITDTLPPAAREYLQKCLDNPRSLKLRCRDILRSHFKGSMIHRFVGIVDIPEPLKDFILLKPTLKCLNLNE